MADQPGPTRGGDHTDPLPSPHESPTVAGRGVTTHTPGVGPPLPERIGRYRITGLLGEGGFGVVYQALQEEPVKRRVALKVLKPGMDSAQVLARFQAEQQALALMDHPGVARVLDGGVTEQGRAYFAMEYVPGLPITDYCDRNRLDTRQRLELLIQVCQAVQHAHQKGVIHRDLKPSNVLVELADGRPTPKVIDFGVAKAVNRDLTERTLHTEMGQIIGTPEYMSPEQAEMSGLDIDTRTDIYSLGVLMYELLTGALPFDPRSLRAKGLVEIQRIIRESEPPKPSTRLSSMLTDERVARETALKRHADLRELVRTLRGDLDWITMKAMEKDRTRRYETAAQFADDLRRFLTHEPVEARPPSVLYLARKFVRRHRWPIGAAGFGLVLLVGGLVGTSIMYARAEEERHNATDAARIAGEERDKAREAMRQAQEARDRAEYQTYLTNISVADASIAAGDYRSARDRLALAPERLRNWEWRYLQAATDVSARVIESPPGDTTLVMGGGGRLWAGLGDGTVMVINAASGDVQVRSGVYPSAVATMAAAPDGSTVYVAHDDGSVHAREGGTLKTLRIIRPPQDVLSRYKSMTEANKARQLVEFAAARVTALAVSGDGQWVAVGCGDGSCHVLAAGDGRQRCAVEATTIRQWGVRLAGFRAQGTQLMTVTDLAAQMWSVEDARAIASVPAFMPSIGESILPAFGVDLTPDSTQLAILNPITTLVQVWDTVSNQRRMTLATQSPPSDMAGAAVRLSDDGQRLAIGLANGTIQVWDVTTPADQAGTVPVRDRARLVKVLPGHRGRIQAVVFSPDRRTLASASRDGTIRIWNPAIVDRPISIGRGSSGPVEFSPDGRRLAYIDNGQCAIYDLSVRRQVGEVAWPGGKPYYDPASGDFAAWADRALSVIHDGKSLERKPVGPDPAAAARRHIPPGARLTRLTRREGNTPVIEISDSVEGKFVAELRPPGPVSLGPESGLVFAPRDGSCCAVLVRPDQAEFIRLPSGERIVGLTVPGRARSIQFTDDGSLAAMMDAGRQVYLIDLRAGRVRRTVELPSPPTAQAFSPDGSRLAVALSDGGIRLLETAELTEVLTLRSGTISPGTVAFSGDGASLAVGGETAVLVWRAQGGMGK